MTNQSFLRISTDYQTNLSLFGSLDGYQQPKIMTIVFSQKKFKRAYPKHAKQFEGIPAFSIGLVFGNTPFGLVVFEEAIEDVFDPGERQFILAHEYTHIIKNHCPLKYLGSAASDFISDCLVEVDSPAMSLILGLAWQLICTCVSARFTSESEIEADTHALQLTGNRAIALKTIEKLVQEFADGDSNRPCHFVLMGKQMIPVLTFQQRLDVLRVFPLPGYQEFRPNY